MIAIAERKTTKLTAKEFAALLVKIRINHSFPYFAKSSLKYISSKGKPTSFVFNTPQRYLHRRLEAQKKKLGYVRAIILKPRQRHGISTQIQGRFLHILQQSFGKRVLIMTEADISRDNLFKMAKNFHEYMPKEVQPKKTKSNEKALEFEGLKCRYDIKTCDSKGGIGSTLHLLHLSELAKFSNTAMSNLGDILETVPCGVNDIIGTEIIKESTAFGAGGAFYQEWIDYGKKELEGNSPYERIFLPWFYSDDRTPVNDDLRGEITNSLDEHEKWLLKQILPNRQNVNIEQLAWRREKLAEIRPLLGYDKYDLFKQSYPATDKEAFLHSGESAFPTDDIRVARSECYTPEFIGNFNAYGSFQQNPKGNVKIWQKPRQNNRYVIGADIALNTEKGDYSSGDVLHVGTGYQVAHIHGKMDTDIFGEMLHHLGRYYNTALIAPEVNIGEGVLTTLKHLRYPNIYQREIKDSSRGMKRTKKAGWYTTKKNKTNIIQQLFEILRDGESGIFNEDTVEELSTFSILNAEESSHQDIYGASPGNYDDRVMSFAIALEMLYTIPQMRVYREQFRKRHIQENLSRN